MRRWRDISVLVIILIFLTACGGVHRDKNDNNGIQKDDGFAPAASLGELNSLESLVFTGSYAGYLMVHFEESVGARLDETGRFKSAVGAGDYLSSINEILGRYQNVEIFRTNSISSDEVDASRARLERLSGKQLADFNSVYRLNVSDPNKAVSLLREFKSNDFVSKVYPGFKPVPFSLDSTPSLVSLQGYLYDEVANGGLNARAMWNEGVFGGGVYIVHNENGVNFDHEDLALSADYLFRGGNFFYQPNCAPGFPDAIENCLHWIAHGTALAGIMIAQENGHGITGFAPEAHYVLDSIDMTVYEGLDKATDGYDDPNSITDDDIEPGSIWLIAFGQAGRYSGGGGGGPGDSQYGYLPMEAWPGTFNAIEQAIAYGVTVVVASGAGQMNLDDESLYSDEWNFLNNLAHEDAGSIIVGGSEGRNEAKLVYSNCGSRLNSFAWGQDVATTGYPYALWGWLGSAPPVPPNDEDNAFFVNNSVGTSTSAAMIAGAATLVQSYARNDLGHKRYLMPSKMREILVDSGVPQSDGGCNIGTQPRLDVAKNLVDSFLSDMRSAYPELDSGDSMTQERMIAMRADGLGIICKYHDLWASDPICPDDWMFPDGGGRRLSEGGTYYIANNYMDFDADGRADLVQWSSGSWKLDLSGIGDGGDNFGEWDLEMAYAPIAETQVWPYVDDLNSDGRSDFILYDKLAGKWYVAFTDNEILRSGGWHGWDWVLDYSTAWHDEFTLDPFGENPSIPDAKYSRPAVGDYNNDGWIDIAVACSDGKWRIDSGGPTRGDYGSFDREVTYLTPAQLADAPGWAYPIAPYYFRGASGVYMGYKVPDGLPDEGRIHLLRPVAYINDWFEEMDVEPIFGGNDVVLSPGKFRDGGDAEVGLLYPDGRWHIYGPFNYEILRDFPPEDVFGGGVCHPMVADFGGDGKSDRAVMCPNEWRIAYSSEDLGEHGPAGLLDLLDADGVRRVPLTYEAGTFTLPGRTYSGGVSYFHVRELIEFFQEANPGVPPPIPVDMPGFGSE